MILGGENFKILHQNKSNVNMNPLVFFLLVFFMPSLLNCSWGGAKKTSRMFFEEFAKCSRQNMPPKEDGIIYIETYIRNDSIVVSDAIGTYSPSFYSGILNTLSCINLSHQDSLVTRLVYSNSEIMVPIKSEEFYEEHGISDDVILVSNSYSNRSH